MQELIVGRITRDWPLNPKRQWDQLLSKIMIGYPTFSSAINQGLQAVLVLRVYHSNQGRIDPTPRFHAIKTTYNKLELHVVFFVLVLDLPIVRCDLNAFHPLLYKSSGNFGF